MIGIKAAPVIQRANVPKAKDSTAFGLRSVKYLDLRKSNEQKYKPTPGTQRAILYREKINKYCILCLNM